MPIEATGSNSTPTASDAAVHLNDVKDKPNNIKPEQLNSSNTSVNSVTNWLNSLDTNKSADTLETQKQRLKQLVELISFQEAKLKRFKALLKLTKEQAAINSELNNQLRDVNKSIDEKDSELKSALNKIDDLNGQLIRNRRTRAYRTSKGTRTEYENKSNNLRNGRRVSFDPLALLLDAAFEGELDLVIQTSKQVPDLSASHEECVTALHNAAVVGHYDVAKYLIDSGCDVNAQDSDGWTPLHCAASCNNLPLVKLLIENGAIIYATTTSDNSTPAMKCDSTEDGYEDCNNYLIYIQNNLGVINNGIVYALYDYDAQEEDELSFKMDEELIVLRRDDSDEQHWWWAQKKVAQPSETMVDIKEGYIPRNLVGLYPRNVSFRAQCDKKKNNGLDKNECKTEL